MFDAILTIFYENDPIISKYFVEEKNDGHTQYIYDRQMYLLQYLSYVIQFHLKTEKKEKNVCNFVRQKKPMNNLPPNYFQEFMIQLHPYTNISIIQLVSFMLLYYSSTKCSDQNLFDNHVSIDPEIKDVFPQRLQTLFGKSILSLCVFIVTCSLVKNKCILKKRQHQC